MELILDARLVGDVSADAAVAGGVVGHFGVAVDGVAVGPVEGVVHALRVVARFAPEHSVLAGDRRGRRLAGRDRVDREGPVPLAEDEDLLIERHLGVLPGIRMAHPIAAAPAEHTLHNTLAGVLVARHPVHFAVGEYLARGAAVEAGAAAGDVAHLRHRLFEALDDPAAVALGQRREADLPALAHGGVAVRRVGRLQMSSGAVLAVLAYENGGTEEARLALALMNLDRAPQQLVAIEIEGHIDLLVRRERLNRADHRHRAVDLRPPLVQVADMSDLHRRPFGSLRLRRLPG